uniref:Rhodanese domain-containing protein n=1 Tax=Romanomermis culicivorax TaxID=13658 RepID=A0A915K8Z5_ROMCU
MYDPDRPIGTLQRMPGPPPQQPYYFADRVSYASPAGTGRYTKSAVTVEHYKPAFGPCMWILTILAILLVLILVICLILFFTWGSGYRGNGSGVSYYDKSGGPPHALEQPEFILNALKSGDRKLCVLDTAYMNPNYAQLYAEEHIPSAKFELLPRSTDAESPFRHFDINKVLNKNTNFGDQSVVTPLVNILDFQNYVRSLGVTKDCHVTLYDHGEAKNSILTATYVWYLFRLHNYNKVTIINGGLKAWKEWTKNEPRYQATNIISQNGNVEGDFQYER